MQNKLFSRTGAIIIGSVIILLIVGGFVLRGQANSAASTYTKALKQHTASYDTKITAIGNQATDTSTIAGGRAVLQAYQPVVKEMGEKQPKLASVPLGSVVSGSYKKAANLEEEFSSESKNIYSLGVAADQYYGTYDSLLQHLKNIGVIGSGINLEETALASLASQASEQDLQGYKDIRTKIADGRRSFKEYVDAFKVQVKDLPLPDRYASERNTMYATADRFMKYQNDTAQAYEDGDAAKIKQLAAEGRNANGSLKAKYNMIDSATKPYSDPDKLKDPYGLYAKHFNALIDKVKNS